MSLVSVFDLKVQSKVSTSKFFFCLDFRKGKGKMCFLLLSSEVQLNLDTILLCLKYIFGSILIEHSYTLCILPP